MDLKLKAEAVLKIIQIRTSDLPFPRTDTDIDTDDLIVSKDNSELPNFCCCVTALYCKHPFVS